MATYVVMERGGLGRDRTSDAMFVRDGFHVLAFLIPVAWLLWHRLWIEAALVLAVQILLAMGSELAGVPLAGAVASFVVSIWSGLEGPALRIAALRRRGWTERTAVEAQSLDEAELRYLLVDGDGDVEAAEIATPRHPQRVPAAAALPVGPALGLMAYPDRR
ncbi:MAG: DUF2628 domain-containing protein [Rhizobiaceae bacterium]